MPDTAVLVPLLLSFIAGRIFFVSGILISLFGLIHPGRIRPLLCLLLLLAAIPTSYAIGNLWFPELSGFARMPYVTLLLVPFYIVFTVLVFRIPNRKTLEWAYRLPIISGAAAIALIIVHFIIY